MTFNTLVVDSHAISALDAALIDEAWFEQFTIPENGSGLRRVVLGDVVYILSNDADVDSAFLVANIGPQGVLLESGRNRSQFEKILRVSLRRFDRNVTLPVQWQVYHDGSRISVWAGSMARKVNTRLCFEQAAGDGRHLYAYGITEGPRPLGEVEPDHHLFQNAINQIEEAIYGEQPSTPPVGNFGILLSEQLGRGFGGSATLEQWLTNRLNREQLSFVEKLHNGPVRLRGAAGTGKTQAMVIKCLKDMYDDADGENAKSFAFLTHSSSLAHEVVWGMLYSLDPSERWRTLRTQDERPKLWTGTLYELAQDWLDYGRKGLMPLSLDGREGRELQRLLINDALSQVNADPRIGLDTLANEDEFKNRISSLEHRPALVEELMNEFACVLDAENIRKGTAAAETYLSGAREMWQMELQTRGQREAVLETYETYRASLKNERLLSMDQMVADFGRYLLLHEWEQLRERLGFDVIFVDEYHYLNRLETMTLQSLFRSRAEVSGRWPLFMAYDLKQSTTDAPLGIGVERFRNPGVGASTRIELIENYRSTPQIAAFLKDLDAAFPSMDLEGEYNTHIASSQQAEGEVPLFRLYSNNLQLVDGVFNSAVQIARRIGGKRVAVLCLNSELFDMWRAAGRLEGKFVSVTSREELKELQYANTRCVFSMPEYVAGLQFDTVFIIHADQADLSDEYLSQGARRRYVNRLYLGASRAQKCLMIAASDERGGQSEVLNGPLQNGSLLKNVSP